MDPKSLLRMSLLCKDMNAMIVGNSLLWKCVFNYRDPTFLSWACIRQQFNNSREIECNITNLKKLLSILEDGSNHTQHYSESLPGSSAFYIMESINSKTTPEKLESLIGFSSGDFRLDSGGRCGWNVFGTAAAYGNLELLEYLIAKSPSSIDLGNEFGWTPLFCLVYVCDGTEDDIYVRAKFLLEHGADPLLGTFMCSSGVRCKTTPRDFTPIHAAKKRGFTKVLALLESHKPKPVILV